MNIKKQVLIGLGVFALTISFTVSADTFWKTGNIERTLIDGPNFGGCMVAISTIIGNGCPGNGWLSLDCHDVYYAAGSGNRKYATVLTAYALNKRISVKLDNTKKHDGYCVAERLDMHK